MSNRINPGAALYASTVLALGHIGELSVGAAIAQEAAIELNEVETIVVTGSLLKRATGDVAQPITTVQAEDLLRVGATNAERIMQQIAQNQSATTTNVNLGAGTGGAAYANLRALGSARTLVLINGKRVVNSPYQSLGVDLNTIPTALIERVEVLTDGGSATYGTDAIAGVMNFITARETHGLSISGTLMQPEASGGAEQYQGSVSAGYGSLRQDGWNLYGGVTWREQKALPGVARDFMRSSYIPERGIDRLAGTTFPANYTQPATGITSSVNPAFPTCDPPSSLPDVAFGVSACGYDQHAVINQMPPQEQASVFVRGAMMLGDATVSVEYLRAENEILAVLSPQGLQGLQLTQANPYYPGQGVTPGAPGLDPAQPIFFNVRTAPLGLRENTFEGYTDRAIALVEGDLAGWDYQASALLSTSTVKVVFENGFPDEARLRDGFAGANGAPFLNPFGPQTTEGLAYWSGLQVRGEAQRSEGDLIVYGAQASRDLWRLPAGPAALAIAVEFKNDRAKFSNNHELFARSPNALGNISDISGERDSKSLALELNVPVLQTLEVGVSGRYDDYDGFGGTVNPEISIRYEPADLVTLRGSYSTGFRAPTLYDVFQPNTINATLQRYHDPVLCPGGVVNVAAGGNAVRDCNVNFGRLSGGNANLDPEESRALSIGFQVDPSPNLSFGVDYWRYTLEQTISPLAEQAIFGDPAKYASVIVRCSQVSQDMRATQAPCQIPGGDPIVYIAATNQNLGDTRTSGFDLTGRWSSGPTDWGTYGLTYRASYVSEHEFQREPGGAFFRRAGRYFDGTPVIRYSHFATLSWEGINWEARLTSRYKSGYTDCNCGVAPAFFNEVEANSLWDLSLGYTGIDRLALSLTVVNLLDEEPPFTNKSSGISIAFDDRFADPLLRSFVLSATYEF